MNDNEESIEDRVKQFLAMELPGQPRAMHIGTMNLVKDLFHDLETCHSIIVKLTNILYEYAGITLTENKHHDNNVSQ